MLYEKPKIEILKLETEDVIRTSVDNNKDNNFTPSSGSWA